MRTSRSTLSLCAAAALLLLAAGCASVREPPREPPEDPVIVAMTQTFHLDAAQKERVRVLLKEFDDRNTLIRESWQKNGRVRIEELLASQGMFRRDFLAALTEPQRRIYRDIQLSVQTGGRYQPPRG